MKVTEGTKTFKNQDQIGRLRFSPRGFYHYLIHSTHLKHFIFFLFLDFVIIVFSLYFSFFIRFEFTIPSEYIVLLLDVIPVFLLIKLTSFYYFKVYKITWGYVGINDLINIAVAQTTSISMLMILVLIPLPAAFNSYIPDFFSFDIRIHGFPRSVFLIDGMVSLGLFCGLRFSKRLFLEIIHKRATTHTGKKTFIIGAGNTGEMIIRNMKMQGYRDYYPLGLLDDNKDKVGTFIHGLKVFGTTDKLNDVVVEYGIEALIIAIPSLNYKDLRRMYMLAKSLKVDTIKIVPRIYDFHKPSINIKTLEDIKIEDLLGRQVVDIGSKEINVFLKHKIILITGAGGSIGSEIAIQACSFQPEKVILLDIDETELHNVNHRLKRLYPTLFNSMLINSRIQDKVVLITGDIRDVEVVNEVFGKFKPHIVFHAAAYKHVPMMEINCKEAVKVNMFGTHNLVKASTDYHVEKFIFISTDKAVRPTSIMGATKRMSEYICTAFNSTSGTSFMSVRFGNVLGSRGSVIPTFLEQLKHGGPITITHKDVERFFMTIPEAVALVLQASVIGKGGDILVLDMGEPVKILTLAEELIRIHGLQPYRDIDIQFIGLRAGEKLFEETLSAEEGTTASKHKKIFIAKHGQTYSRDEIEKTLRAFEKLLKVLPIMDNYEIIRDVLRKYVKSFERRGYYRQNQQLECTDSELLQNDEAHVQNNKVQFEKFLNELPAIEDYEIIRATLGNYINILEKRRHNRISQKSEKVATTPRRIEPVRKDLQLV